jgi:hypothetical protein
MEAPMSDSQQLQTLDPRELRNQSTVTVDIGGGRCVVAQRLDMTSMVFEGLVPMPLLTAVQRMISMPEEDPIARLASMEATDKQSMLEMLRKHACRAVINPVVTPTDDGDQNHLPVSLLAVDILMKIWNATAVEPLLSPLEATTFRPRGSADADPVLPAREDVRPAAAPVAAKPAELELKHA